MPAPRRHSAESAPSKIRCPYCLWLLFGLVACVAWPGLALGATLFGPVWLVLLVVPFLSALLRRIVL